MLERKLARDLWRLKGQVATIALVLACGIMAMVMLRSTWSSLIAARDAYYEQYRFGDIFAHLERAPDALAARLEAIPGVARAYPRLVEDIMVPLAGEPDPVTGRIVSLPDDGVPPLDGLYLRSGRLPAPGAEDEAVILEQFALAHGLVPGDTLPAVIEGHLRHVRVVGIALSPEYVIAMSSAAPIADNRRFVVLWMLRREIAPAFRMEGAFDDVVIQLEPHAQAAAVLDEVDRQLVRYGGRHSVARDKQPSNYALISELSVLKTVALIVPTVFLLVAAFLVNVVISRLVFLERTQIAVLKALGFSNRRVGMHYLGLVALIVGIASVIGVGFGVWAGRWMTNLYSEFYKFPHSLFHVAPGVVAYTIAIGLGAATVGALASVLRVTRMAPAQAMRPPSPLSYRRALVDRLGLARVVGASGTMVVREIQRRPLRMAMSIAGIAMGVGIFIMGTFSRDSFDHLFDVAYPREHEEDMTVIFSHPRPDRAVRELEHLPGVRIAEPEHVVPVRFRAGPRWRDSVIFGLAAPGQLRHLLDHDTIPLELPSDGVVMTDKLAQVLGVAVGGSVDVDIMEGDWKSRSLVVRALIHEPFGMQAYANTTWLSHFLDQEPRSSAVLLDLERDRLDDVRARLKELPYVVGVTSTENIISRYREQTGKSMLVMTLILSACAAAISIGVVYNNARIALSMRSRDLATLRVLGFTRREISSVLLGELGFQMLVGIPLGLVFGAWSTRLFVFDDELIRFPTYIAPATYAAAATIAAVSGVISALLVRRKLDRLDLVEVLKSSE